MNWLQKIKNRFQKRNKLPDLWNTKFIPPSDAKRTEWREFKNKTHGKPKQLT